MRLPRQSARDCPQRSWTRIYHWRRSERRRRSTHRQLERRLAPSSTDPPTDQSPRDLLIHQKRTAPFHADDRTHSDVLGELPPRSAEGGFPYSEKPHR